MKKKSRYKGSIRNYKKYEGGGFTPAHAGALSQGAGMVGGLLQTSEDETAQGAGSFLSGAGNAFSMATAATGNPLVGAGAALVGGGISLYKHLKDKKANEERMAQEKEAREKAQAERRRIVDTAKLYNYDSDGDHSKAIYKYGGTIYDSMSHGGKLKSLSSNTAEVVGNSHENGGVKFPKQGVELEGGETIKNLKDHTFVYSEETGHAQRHKKIAKKKAKLEGRTDKRSLDTLKRLEVQEEDLMIEQEQMKEDMRLSEYKKNKKYNLGGFAPEGINIKNNLYQDNYVPTVPSNVDNIYEQDRRNTYIREKFNPESPVYKVFSQFDGKINNYQDLQKYAKQAGVNPDSFSDALDTRYGKGTTGSRGHGKNKYENLEQMNFDAYKRYSGDYKNRENSYIPEPSTEPRPTNVPSATPSSNNSTTQAEENIQGETLSARGFDKLGFKKAGIDALGVGSRFVDNIVNSKIIKRLEDRDIPQEDYRKNIKLKGVDYDAQKIAADETAHNTAKAIQQGIGSSSAAASAKASTLATAIAAKNKIREAEENTNTSIRSKETLANSEIDAGNIKTKFNNSILRYRKDSEIDSMKSSEAKNISEDLLSITQDLNKQNLADRQNKLNVLLSDPRKVEYLSKIDPSQLKKWGISNEMIKEIQSGNFSSEYLERFTKEAST